jgi:hypothetical protein
LSEDTVIELTDPHQEEDLFALKVLIHVLKPEFFHVEQELDEMLRDSPTKPLKDFV